MSGDTKTKKRVSSLLGFKKAFKNDGPIPGRLLVCNPSANKLIFVLRVIIAGVALSSHFPNAEERSSHAMYA